MTLERPRPRAIDNRRIHRLVERAAALPDVRTEAEANHDDNRWWPLSTTDHRMRMLAAGWSTRVSYRMVETYRHVILAADARGFDVLANASDDDLGALVRPIGLPRARIDYLRSLVDLCTLWDKQAIDPSSPTASVDDLVADFAERVRGASFKVAQCALLNARGYHSGIVPVDSGMVGKLAPALGIELPSGAVAHERFRHILEAAVHAHRDDFRALAVQHEYAVTIPDGAEPTWWVHLVLIYFKRLYLNGPSPRLCTRRPVCTQVVDCPHRKRGT
ncbi:hypothetical protein [Actinacidiphila epipremni]|uniref:Uncharacterized protein n=1 Tax=Actinacidiphila epipremni TaxID=2053013 RepID=A0ABX0ZKV9_9ACTN|nr:hypothetical protein [Actinacidiphila epipremni]NJP43137.1 hypothetical protein [Actinacidiphila epipremni]